MRYLLDTCVLSELRRKDRDAGVVQAVRNLRDEDAFISVISVGEITKGIFSLRVSKRRRHLEEWLEGLEKNFQGRILSLDLETAHIWGEITAEAAKAGRTIPVADGCIAASARRHGLHVMTRNVRDFAATGVMVVNPWSG